MITLDTNVVVRYLAKDDPVQAQVAAELITNNPCLIQHTVLLETAWVLASKNGHHWQREQVIERFEYLFSVPTLLVDKPLAVKQALKWYADGMDFADALHLANTEDTFATFDRRLSKKATELQAEQNVILLGNEIH